MTSKIWRMSVGEGRERGWEGGKIMVFERAARRYFPEAFRETRAGYIQGSGVRDWVIISQKRDSPSTCGTGGVSFGREGFLRVWRR